MASPDGAFAATVRGVLDRVRNRAPELVLDDARLDGRTMLVTGANRGLGLAIARALTSRGARVLAACRSGVGEAAAHIGANAEARPLDLGELDSVERLAASLADDRVVLDVAVLNAGMVASRARATRDGFDETFQVNFLANVLLIRRLLERGVIPLGAGAAARIVMVSSELHRNAAPIDFARLGAIKPWGMRRAVAEYGASKLLAETWADELTRRLARSTGGAAVHSICPGAVNTDIAREAPSWAKPALSVVMRAFFQSPEKAAEPVVYLAASPSIERETGIYLHARRRKPRGDRAQDRDVARRLWDESERLLAGAGHPLAPLPEGSP